MPKTVIEKAEDVPAELKSHYEEKDGKFYLKLEGEVPELETVKGQLASFRDNNRSLNEKLVAAAETLKKFDGVDPALYSKLKQQVEDFTKKTGATDPGDVEARINAAVAAQVKAATEPLIAQVATLSNEKKAADQKLAERDLEKILRDAAGPAGIIDTAMPDFLARGKSLFVLEGGVAVPKRNDSTVFSKKDVTKPMSPTEWIETDLSKEAPHFFKPSKGGGAPGTGGGGRVRTIASDPRTIGANLEALAKGEVQVESNR